MNLESDWAEVRRQLSSGDHTEALLCCQRLLGKPAQAGAAEARLAVLALQANKTEAGRAFLEASRQHAHQLDPTALADLGGGFFLLGETKEGLPYLHTAVEKEPDNGVAQARLGMSCLKLRLNTLAQKHLSLAHTLLPDNPTILVNLAKAALRLGQPKRALDKLQQAWRLGATPTAVTLEIEVESLVALDRSEEANRPVEEALARSWENPDILRICGRFYATQDRHADAEIYLRRALEYRPDDIAILEDLITVIQSFGRYDEAVHMLERILQQAPEVSSHWTNLSRGYIDQGHLLLARQAAEKACTLAEDQDDKTLKVNALCALAQVHQESEQNDEAEARYRQALEISPTAPLALLGLGGFLMQGGKIDEATALFEKAASVRFIPAQVALINARIIPDDEADLDRIEKAAKRPGLFGSIRHNLLLSVATAWDKKGNQAKAFELATQANHHARQFLDYDAGENQRKTDAIIHHFNADFIRQRSGFGHTSQEPVFVLGMPRSGTTLVEQILASHPQVFGAGELGQIPALIHRLTLWEQHIGSGRVFPEYLQDFSQYEAEKLARLLLKDLRTLGQGADRIIDKLPHNFQNIGLIHLLFPKAAIIHLVREPKDIALSNFFTHFRAAFHGMGFAYDLTDLALHIADYQRLMAHWHDLFPGKILDVRYEDLVEDLPTAAQRILDFVQLPWNPQVLAFNTLERPVKTASLWQVRQPLYKSSIEKWRRYAPFLGPFEQALKTGQNRQTPPPPTQPPRATLPAFNIMVDGHRAGNLAEVKPLYEQLLAANPDHAGALQMLGVLHLQQNRPNQAIALLEKALSYNPQTIQCYNNLGAAYCAVERWDDAQSAYVTALTHRPDYVPALDGLATVFERLGDKDKSREIREKIQQLAAPPSGARKK
ncbi:MAG: sulfotransferase [Magnetococcales bacterium]|nr:sulfotransferase [Magnetococcales bacterium]